MGAWASAAREGSPVTKSLVTPHYSRKAVHVPNGDEFARQMLKMVAPNLPVVAPKLPGVTYSTQLIQLLYLYTYTYTEYLHGFCRD